MNKLILSLVILFNQTSYAEVTLLEKGQPATYRGYLFSPDQELEVRTKVQKVNLLESMVVKQQEQIDVMSDRIGIKEQQIDNLSEQLSLAETQSSFNKVLYFVLGAVISGGIMYGFNRK